MADTGFKSPSAHGDDYNEWVDSHKLYASDNSYNYESTIGEMQDVYNFTLGVPAGATIDGIEITFEGVSYVSGTCVVEVELSWDGGASYTSQNKQNTFTTSESTETYGGSTDTWGRTWSSTELTNTNFRVRIELISRTVGMKGDHIQAKVYYTTAAAGKSQVMMANF